MSTSSSDAATTAVSASASTARPRCVISQAPDVGRATLYPIAVPGLRTRLPLAYRFSPIATARGAGPHERSSSTATSGARDPPVTPMLRRCPALRTGPRARDPRSRLVPPGQPSDQEPEEGERAVPVLARRVGHPWVHDPERPGQRDADATEHVDEHLLGLLAERHVRRPADRATEQF